MHNIVIPFGDQHGWGIAGTHVSRELAKLTPIRVLVEHAPDEFKRYIPADWNPLCPLALAEPLLQAISGPTFKPMNDRIRSKTRNIGYAFIEDINLAAQHLENARRYHDHIIAGSTWSADKLRDIGVPSVSVAIQGVDTQVFHPRPRTHETTAGPFTILSPGKLEYRKGHDLVIAVFKKFLANHPDAHLLCCWANHWPQTVDSLSRSPHITYLPVAGDWKLKAHATLLINGIPESHYTLVDALPHAAMAAVYAQADVALFLSRCEAGTNLPLMESMACAVPVIAAAATGQMDVLAPDHAYMVAEGRTLDSDWFDANPDCVVQKLEEVYQDRDAARDKGQAARHFISDFTWQKTAKALLYAHESSR